MLNTISLYIYRLILLDFLPNHNVCASNHSYTSQSSFTEVDAHIMFDNYYYFCIALLHVVKFQMALVLKPFRLTKSLSFGLSA